MPPGDAQHNASSAELARQGPVEDLPLRALSRPRDTARVAQRVLAANRSPYVRSYAGQALGIATREMGDVAQAVRYLRAALALRAAGDSVWEARALNNLGLALIHRGDAPRAEDALTRAEALLADAGRTFDAANVRSNRGLVASLYGQVPEALAHYDAAEMMYADAGVRSAELSEVRCSAFLAVGLYDDALRHGQEAVSLLRSQGASAAYRADALVRAAEAALAANDPQIAR